MKPGFRAVVRREMARAGSSAYYPVLLVALPLLSFAILVAIFGGGVPRDLPVVVLDQDHTALSRGLTRMIDATSSMRVAWQVTNPSAARDLILEGKAYASVAFPADMERDVGRGQAPKVVARYNAQILLPASLIRRDLRAVVSTASAGLERRARQSRGEAPSSALAHIEPIRLDAHALFNPQLNYVHFLVAALLPTMLQLFVTVGTVFVIGVELKESTAGDWLAAAGNSTWRAVAGKLLPYTLHFSVLGGVMLAVIFRWTGAPLRGNAQVLAAATILLVLAYQAVALLLIAWLANLRLATSAAAVYCTPAFAFVGVTFPAIGMPAVGRAWGAILPLTHYLRVLTDQGLRGTPAWVSMPSLGILLVFVLAAPVLCWWRLGRVLRDPKCWGRV